MFSTLVDTIKAAKSSDSIEDASRSPTPRKRMSSVVAEKVPGGRRLSGIISKMRSRENSLHCGPPQQRYANGDLFWNPFENENAEYDEAQQLLTPERSPRYESNVRRVSSPSSMSDDYSRYRMFKNF
ncbi:unnamed protein product [Gongylonema pulchrum]|uniref:Uncharacterized protein n=1 Tax=Gongylonema pulchrum TaxID=637853 RepID=A0A3P6PMQ5_9BILA|nr:unnamed protein product [Gongylonema pulchrum]